MRFTPFYISCSTYTYRCIYIYKYSQWFKILPNKEFITQFHRASRIVDFRFLRVPMCYNSSRELEKKKKKKKKRKRNKKKKIGKKYDV